MRAKGISRARAIALGSMLATAASCSAILDLSAFVDDDSAGSGGFDGGVRDDGGGGSGATGCSAGSQRSCTYSGPAETFGVGVCVAGTQTCAADGSGYGPCAGEVLPADEDDCTTDLDENCDGVVNDACDCVPGSDAPCYSGPAGTQGVGVCTGGTMTCNADGKGYGPCVGEVVPAPEDCAQAQDEDCSGFACAEPLWAEIWGDQSDQEASRLGVDAQGALYVGGSFTGSVHLGNTVLISAGGDDVFVAKLDEQGHHLWAKSFGDAGTQLARSIAVDPAGNVVIAGALQGGADFGGGVLSATGAVDTFAAKLDAAGEHIWSKRFTTQSPYGVIPSGVAMDRQGNVLIAGVFGGVTTFGCGTLTSVGGFDVFLAELAASDGACLWSRAFGSSGDDDAGELAVDPGGNPTIVGAAAGAISFGGAVLIPQGSSSPFMARFDSSGQPAFSRLLVGDGTSNITDVTSDSSGDVVLAGSFQGNLKLSPGVTLSSSAATSDVFVAKYTSAGILTWGRAYGDAGHDYGTSVDLDGSDDILLAGRTDGPIDLGGGALNGGGGTGDFITKLGPDGAHVWSKLFPINGQGTVLIQGAPSGDVLVACKVVSGSVDFGTGPLISQGNDIAVAHFAP